jgi:hypothetical protein
VEKSVSFHGTGRGIRNRKKKKRGRAKVEEGSRRRFAGLEGNNHVVGVVV